MHVRTSVFAEPQSVIHVRRSVFAELQGVMDVRSRRSTELLRHLAHMGTPLALATRMLGTVLEVALVTLFGFTLLSAAVAVARRTTDQLHSGPTV